MTAAQDLHRHKLFLRLAPLHEPISYMSAKKREYVGDLAFRRTKSTAVLSLGVCLACATVK
jgi:hypothetical protein